MLENQSVDFTKENQMFVLRYLLAILLIAAMLAGCVPAAAANPDGAGEAEPLVTVQAPTQAPEKSEPVVEPTGAPTAVSAAPAAAAPTAQPTLDPDSPRATIEAFYAWYFSQPRGEVLTERSYNDYPHMTDIQKSDLNYLLDSFKDSSGYDPFVCAQNDLPSLTIAEMFISGGLAYALAEVIIDGQVQHYFVVTADRSEGPWKIGTIFCPRDPQTAAIAFYTWYLGYIYGDQNVENGGEILRNPLVDKAYRSSFLMSETFVNKIEAELAAMRASGGMADPILNAQNLPIRFTVQPLGTENLVAVRLDYDVRSARYHNLVLVETWGGWIVDNIQHVEVARYTLEASPQAEPLPPRGKSSKMRPTVFHFASRAIGR
jgi:hypothetical protein